MHLTAGQFNDSYEPLKDGVVNVVRNYAYWLKKNSWQSYVIAPHFPNYKDSGEFEVLRYFSVEIPVRRPYRLGMPEIDLPFNKRVNEIPLDIIHTHCPFSSGQLGLKLARMKDVPLITTFHSKYYDDFKQAFKSEHVAQMLTKKILSFYEEVDFVWTVNKSTCETLRSYGFKGNIEIVPNGTDFLIPENIESYVKIADERLGLFSEENVFLFVGQHIWQKNLRMLLQSLQLLKNMGIKFKMYFVGSGFAESDLKNLSNQLALEEYVHFLGSISDREFLKSLYSRADLFLFPSVYDNAPIVIREAAAMKCPSLVIEGSNASEGIIDGYNGFTCVDNPELYARKIKAIISGSDNLLRTGEIAQITLYRNWEHIVAEVRERYIEIVKTYKKVHAI
jgi:1,2-diacylglycerol 3-alpha-glucosyltransferase